MFLLSLQSRSRGDGRGPSGESENAATSCLRLRQCLTDCCVLTETSPQSMAEWELFPAISQPMPQDASGYRSAPQLHHRNKLPNQGSLLGLPSQLAR